MNNRILSAFALAAATTLGLSACGSSYASSSSSPTGSGSKDSSTIKIVTTTLGGVLVDGSGRTLYLFTPDGDHASSSKCVGGCATLWTGLQGKPKAGSGVDASLIATTSGSKQASYHGHLLYYYANDAAPGDMNGQGVDGSWYVVNSTGSAVTKAVKGGSGGYSGGGY